MNPTAMLDNKVRLAAAARAAGASWTPRSPFATGYNEIFRPPVRDPGGVVDGNAFVKDICGAAIVDVLAPQAGGIVVTGHK